MVNMFTRKDKIISMVERQRTGKEPVHTTRIFQNRMCNVPLPPIQRATQEKIIILSNVLLSTPSDKEIETTSDEKYSKTSTANFKEEISSFLKIKQKEPKERACDNFIAWNVKKNKRLVTQISYQNSKDIECFNGKDTFSPVDDSDEDPSFSPSQYRKRKKRRFCEISSNSSGSSRRSSSIHYHRSSSEQTQKPIIRKLENFPENLSISQFILLSDEKNTSVDVSKRSNGEHLPKHSNLDKNDNFQKNYDQISYIDSKYLNETHDHSSENQPVTRNEANLINKIEKKPKRKPDYCYFCEQEIQNYARHILRNHSLEIEVQKIMALTPKSRERRLLIDNLRKQGNYLKNVNGYYKPVRSPQINKDNLLPCQNCHGFYSAKLLYRHKKRCLGTSAGSNCRADSQSHLASIINKKVDVQMQEQVFPRMRADKISLEAKKDPLICAFGSRYLKTHREKHFILVTSRKMRELSRLLLFMKKIDPSITNLFGALKPKYFNYFVEATKKVAQYDEVKDAYSAPTFAMNIATSLKQCCEIALTLSLTTNISTSTAEVESDLKNMIHLFTSNWRFEVSNQAANDLSIKKWNKVTIVPLADDLKKLRVHLIERAKDAITSLNNNENDQKAFTTLLETIYCRVILLNRKRPGELERMTLYSYNECINKTDYDEYDSLLTPTEKILLKSFKRVVIRGKRGRGSQFYSVVTSKIILVCF
ncbi:uncharacterized protein isoform X2 [Leptinotarsa decemlineata]|uniref:uncharacterized protein isoform X2 n=1 Tax=Leptinotarsa decemlineata TaxID=7539 RepID=UPI003D3078B0